MRLVASADALNGCRRASRRCAHNPQLIYARGHGLGVRGPEVNRPSYGMSAFWNDVDCPNDEVHIGMAVEVVFDDLSDEVTLPRFRPAA